MLITGNFSLVFCCWVIFSFEFRPVLSHSSALQRMLHCCFNSYELLLYFDSKKSLSSVLWRCWLGGRKGIRPIKNWVVGCWRGICLELGADLHMAQLMPLQPTVSCFSKIQIGFTFLVPAHPGSPGKRAIKRMCVCLIVKKLLIVSLFLGDWFFVIYFCLTCPGSEVVMALFTSSGFQQARCKLSLTWQRPRTFQAWQRACVPLVAGHLSSRLTSNR